MVWFALSFQGQVEKYGAYVGIAAFFGLAILSLLYFSQARELKRLREWAGRAPERAQELEQRVVAQAASAGAARRAALPSATGAIARPRRLAEMPAPPAAQVAQATELVDAVAEEAPTTNGNVPVPPRGPGGTVPAGAGPLNGAAPQAEAEAEAEPAAADAPDDSGQEPADTRAPDADAAPADTPAPAEAQTEVTSGETTAPADAEADGVASREAEPVPAPALPVAAATATGATTPTPATGATAPAGEPVQDEPAPAPAPPTTAIPRATPAQRVGVTPRPAPLPLRQSKPSAVPPSQRGAPRRPGTAAPPKPRRERRSAGSIALVIGLAVLLLGGGTFLASQLLGGDDTPAPPNQAAPPPTQTQDDVSGAGRQAQSPPGETNVAVLNGTTFTGLAGQIADRVSQEGGYERGITETNTRDQTLQASTVFFADGFRASARAVARMLSIDAVEPIDEETAALAPGADVVVLAGADQAP